jgi:hypothetical protein
LKIDPNAALAKEGLQKIKEEKASYGLQ